MTEEVELQVTGKIGNLELDQSKVHEFKDIVVLIGDGRVDKHKESVDIKNVAIPDEPVQVSHDFNHMPIGIAQLFKEDKSVKANIKLYDQLIKPEVARNLIPCVGGYIGSAVAGEVSTFEVSNIGLCEENADARIPKLGESKK